MKTCRQWQLDREAAERYERVLVPAARALVEWVELPSGEVVLRAAASRWPIRG